MLDKVKISIDVMGGDNSPYKTLEGLNLFAKRNQNINDYIFYLFATTGFAIIFGYITTWMGYLFAPVEQGYLLFLSTWVSMFNAFSAFIANWLVFFSAAGSIFGLPFGSLMIVLIIYSILMSLLEYGWAIAQGISQYYVFMLFCFTGGLFKNGGLCYLFL